MALANTPHERAKLLWEPVAHVCVSATSLAESGFTAGTKGLALLNDQTLREPEWRLDSASVETIEPSIPQTEIIEPRAARIVSIEQLRQKLGLEKFEQPVARTAPPAQGRPRIVRRREAEPLCEALAG